MFDKVTLRGLIPEVMESSTTNTTLESIERIQLYNATPTFDTNRKLSL